MAKVLSRGATARGGGEVGAKIILVARFLRESGLLPRLVSRAVEQRIAETDQQLLAAVKPAAARAQCAGGGTAAGGGMSAGTEDFTTELDLLLEASGDGAITARSEIDTAVTSSRAADTARQRQVAMEVTQRLLWLHDSYIAEELAQLMGTYPCFAAQEGVAGRTAVEVRAALLQGVVLDHASRQSTKGG